MTEEALGYEAHVKMIMTESERDRDRMRVSSRMKRITDRKLAEARAALLQIPSVRDRIWRSIRILRRFSLTDLMMTANATYSQVSPFVSRLIRGGFVARMTPANVRLAEGSFALLRNSGPLTPMPVLDGIFDPNTRTLWTREGEPHES